MNEIWKQRLRGGMKFLLWPFFAFLPAGTLDWPEAWITLGVMYGGILVNLVFLLKANPALLDERLKPDFRAEAKAWDRRLMLIALPFTLAWTMIPGFGVRFGWPRLPEGSAWLGWGLLVFCFGMFVWVMSYNRFLSRVVYIQKDHQVITEGPYRIVRHPLYVMALLYYLAWPLSLGSLYGLYAALCCFPYILIRTALEDATLRAELPGYQAYTQQTRYRLLPGIW